MPSSDLKKKLAAITWPRESAKRRNTVIRISRPFTRIPSPTSRTPFPYTTLFRSDQVHDLRIGAAARCDRIAHHPFLLRATGRDVAQHLRIGRDRKSTRLNSSHSQISYAVF